jgi:hypothetical protein
MLFRVLRYGNVNVDGKDAKQVANHDEAPVFSIEQFASDVKKLAELTGRARINVRDWVCVNNFQSEKKKINQNQPINRRE